jgi:hypothetical protein
MWKTKVTSKQVLENMFSADKYSQCNKISANEDQSVGNIDLDGCDVKITMKQDAYYEDDCALKSTIDSLTDFALENKQKIKDGVLPKLSVYNENSTKEKIKSDIEAHITSMCGDAKAKESQTVGNILCKASKLDLDMLQNFRGKSACVVNDVMNRADKWEAKQKQEVDSSLFGDLFAFFKGMGTLYLVGLIVAAVVFLAILFFLTTDGGQQTVKTAAPLMLL